MSRLVLALLLVSVASSASAQAATSTTPTPSLVFVYDGGGAHVSGDRVRRALAAGLHRPVLRLTDADADCAVGRLTIAFDAPDHWVIDFVRGEAHTTRTVVLRNSTVARLARVAMAIIADTEPGPATTLASTPSARRSEWIALIGDEILDPFGSAQPAARTRRSMALVQEFVDPFANTPGRQLGYDDVIDPWSH